ncbi:host attachment protein [Gallaecimonas kandeliae]|uniref:host attachment protein n=1 Tax=Gallaecimonas kandeliae TaxID=3029055 RepID=UPI0026492507|nr:host attachment protein [Gallaecimonas kandeliae]WKE67006.1 host attachment protein [Gallaecimonas kandeliae]
MKGTWVVVADSATARIFDVSDKGELQELETLAHPSSRLREKEISSDRSGMVRSHGGNAVYSVDADPHGRDHEAEVFAKEIGDKLESFRQGKAYGRLLLVAAPRFLGQLRSALSPATSALVSLSLDKELTRLLPGQIAEHLPPKFWRQPL